MHELRKDYGRITDGNYGVLDHFYDYIFGILHRTTLTFLAPTVCVPYIIPKYKLCT